MNKEQVRKLAAQAGYDVEDDGIYMPTIQSNGDPSNEEAMLTEFARLVEMANEACGIPEDKLASARKTWA